MRLIRKFLSKFKREEEGGGIIIIVAMCFTVLCIFMAFAFDVGFNRTIKTRLQTAVDSAASEVGTDFPIESSQISEETSNINSALQAQGLDISKMDVDLEWVSEDSSTINGVRITVTSHYQSLFAVAGGANNLNGNISATVKVTHCELDYDNLDPDKLYKWVFKIGDPYFTGGYYTLERDPIVVNYSSLQNVFLSALGMLNNSLESISTYTTLRYRYAYDEGVQILFWKLSGSHCATHNQGYHGKSSWSTYYGDGKGDTTGVVSPCSICGAYCCWHIHNAEFRDDDNGDGKVDENDNQCNGKSPSLITISNKKRYVNCDCWRLIKVPIGRDPSTGLRLYGVVYMDDVTRVGNKCVIKGHYMGMYYGDGDYQDGDTDTLSSNQYGQTFTAGQISQQTAESYGVASFILEE